jgi:hypothetical protein
MFFVKIHKKLGREVLAICDENILGKTLDDGKIHFEIKSDFYQGEKMSEKQVKVLLKDSPNYNLIGKEIVRVAIEIGVVEKENVIKIKGIPHAQGLFL